MKVKNLLDDENKPSTPPKGERIPIQVISPWTNIAEPFKSSTAFSSFSFRRPNKTTLAPSLLKTRAVASPIPEPPPVMIAVLPFNLIVQV